MQLGERCMARECAPGASAEVRKLLFAHSIHTSTEAWILSPEQVRQGEGETGGNWISINNLCSSPALFSRATLFKV